MFEKGECPEDDGVDYTVDEPEEEEIDDVEKAEEVLFDEDETDIFKADFSEKERKKLAKKKEALPDGSFPIRNASDLKNAIQAIGRAKDPTKAKAWIKKRAKALGKEDLLPDTWKAEDVLNFGEEDMDLQKAESILFSK